MSKNPRGFLSFLGIKKSKRILKAEWDVIFHRYDALVNFITAFIFMWAKLCNYALSSLCKKKKTKKKKQKQKCMKDLTRYPKTHLTTQLVSTIEK